MDWPAYDGALALEYGQNPPNLDYKTATDVDTLTGFDRTEMNTLGGKEIPVTGGTTSGRATLFAGQPFYANDLAQQTVMLDLTLGDGQAEVTVAPD